MDRDERIRHSERTFDGAERAEIREAMEDRRRRIWLSRVVRGILVYSIGVPAALVAAWEFIKALMRMK